jgi:hypothetical protein
VDARKLGLLKLLLSKPVMFLIWDLTWVKNKQNTIAYMKRYIQGGLNLLSYYYT